MTTEKESDSYLYLRITHQYGLIPKIVRYLVQLPEQQTLQDLTLSIHKLVKYDATEKIFDPPNQNMVRTQLKRNLRMSPIMIMTCSQTGTRVHLLIVILTEKAINSEGEV